MTDPKPAPSVEDILRSGRYVQQRYETMQRNAETAMGRIRDGLTRRTERTTAMTVWPDVQAPSGYRPGPKIRDQQQAPLPHVVGQVTALRNLPHRTILRVQDGQAAQIINDDTGHYLAYAGTDLTDSLDPTDLFWDRSSMDSLIRMLPAVIVDQP